MRYLKETDEVEFFVTMPDYTWIGLVLGAGDMTYGSDMAFFYADKELSGTGDYNSVGFGEPELDRS